MTTYDHIQELRAELATIIDAGEGPPVRPRFPPRPWRGGAKRSRRRPERAPHIAPKRRPKPVVNGGGTAAAYRLAFSSGINTKRAMKAV